MQRIRRNASYYTDPSKQNHWCTACYNLLKDNAPVALDDGSEMSKSSLQKLKNDAMPEEAWVQCDDCKEWVHQICALFNGRRNKTAAAYTCPSCHVKKKMEASGEKEEETVQLHKCAKDLPHFSMSEVIEKGLEAHLDKCYHEKAKELRVSVNEVEKVKGLSVRVVSNMERQHCVRDEMVKYYAKKKYPSQFPVRSKCILLFQTIHGVDMLLFGMYVYEYGHDCPAPNRRRVYISYLDSVQYFEPKEYRTTVYHSILIEYLRFVKMRGFHTAHIWSCPPSKGDDYIFYCHPSTQLTPKDEMLCKWYRDMLKKAEAEGVVMSTELLHDNYFTSSGEGALDGKVVDATSLPYFEGDYISGELENIIKDVVAEEAAKKKERAELISSSLLPKTTGRKLGTRSNPGTLVNQTQDLVMIRLGQALVNMKENFIVANLLSREFAAAVDRGEDVSDWDEDAALGHKEKKPIGGKDSGVLGLTPSKDRDEEAVETTNPEGKVSKAKEIGTATKDTKPETAAKEGVEDKTDLNTWTGGENQSTKEVAPNSSNDKNKAQVGDDEGKNEYAVDMEVEADRNEKKVIVSPGAPISAKECPNQEEGKEEFAKDCIETDTKDAAEKPSDKIIIDSEAVDEKEEDAAKNDDEKKGELNDIPKGKEGEQSSFTESKDVEQVTESTAANGDGDGDGDANANTDDKSPNEARVKVNNVDEDEFTPTDGAEVNDNQLADDIDKDGENLQKNNEPSEKTSEEEAEVSVEDDQMGDSNMAPVVAVTDENKEIACDMLVSKTAKDTNDSKEAQMPPSDQTIQDTVTENPHQVADMNEEEMSNHSEDNDDAEVEASVEHTNVKSEEDPKGENLEALEGSKDDNGNEKVGRNPSGGNDGSRSHEAGNTCAATIADASEKKGAINAKGVFSSKKVGSTVDKDPLQESEVIDSRQQFLNYCQTNHFQFDEQRRGKHSTMMILFHLHNPSAPRFVQQCGACYREITCGVKYHCNQCSNFDLCSECYKPVTTGLWARRDGRFRHDCSHTFSAINMDKEKKTDRRNRQEREDAIRMHLELLAHAARCPGPPACTLNNCIRMKKLFQHVRSCEVTYKRGCKVCARLLALLSMHARMCNARGSCPIPFCDRIRERDRRLRRQQQLMDDRRRATQNELYRQRAMQR